MDLLGRFKQDLNLIFNIDGVDAIIIFGSYATGKIKPLSDLDICVITDKNISELQKEKILSYKNELFDINLFENLPLSLQYKVLNFGKIYSTKKDLTLMKNKITNQWFDFKPILNRIYTRKGLLPIM